MVAKAGNGWTSPQIIIAVISLLMAAGGSYLALARDDTQDLQRRINAVEGDIRELKADVRWLSDQERRAR